MPNTATVVLAVLRDAYEQGLRKDMAATLAYGHCKAQLLRVPHSGRPRTGW